MNAPQGWTLEDGGKALVRTLKFKDFGEAFAFLTRVAMHAEKVESSPRVHERLEPRRFPPDDP